MGHGAPIMHMLTHHLPPSRGASTPTHQNPNRLPLIEIRTKMQCHVLIRYGSQHSVHQRQSMSQRRVGFVRARKMDE